MQPAFDAESGDDEISDDDEIFGDDVSLDPNAPKFGPPKAVRLDPDAPKFGPSKAGAPKAGAQKGYFGSIGNSFVAFNSTPEEIEAKMEEPWPLAFRQPLDKLFEHKE